MARTTGRAGGPGFVQDHSSIVRSSGRQIDWALVPENMRRTAGQVVTTTALAAAAATSISVAALAGPIASGTVLNFTGAGKFAVTTADAAAGATSLSVEALDAQIDSGDTATVAGSGNKFLPAGTVVSENVVGDVRKVYPRSEGGSTFGILETDAEENEPSAALSGYGVMIGGRLYEALLPEAAGTPRVIGTTIRNELLALPGGGFSFEPYTDNTATV